MEQRNSSARDNQNPSADGPIEGVKNGYAFKRHIDFLLSLILLLTFLIPIIILAILVKITSKGRVFHVSDRVGLNNTIFKMYKFRTMRIDAPIVATHLMEDPDSFVTPIGGFLRKTSLDELPQLFNILKGDMSFVGPRPALFNQDDLIALRTERGIHRLIPGLTGWAQINGRDELPIPVKVAFDEYYMKRQSLTLDVKIIGKTFLKVIKSEGINH